MKTFFIGLLISMLAIPAATQNVVYSSLKDLLAQRGDTVESLRIEKRTKNQIVLSGGADYRITAGDDEPLCRLLKKKCYAVCSEQGNLYVNCRKLRYKKLRFGAWYAPAILLGNTVYFSAIPLGSVVGATFMGDDDVKLGGTVGDALAASSLVFHRVYYTINPETGKVEFFGKDKLLLLLETHPKWRDEYLKESGNCQEAKVIEKYLIRLKAEKEASDLIFF